MRERSLARRAIAAMVIATIGLGVTYALYHWTHLYFSSVVVVTVTLIALYSGTWLALLFAVDLSLTTDYFFLPPIGRVLEGAKGWEHFAIVVIIAVGVAMLASSARAAFRDAVHATRQAEIAKREAERTAEFMEKVLALVSHDVRNPLAAVKMAAQLSANAPPEKQAELRTVMLRNLRQADSIIQSLLDSERIRSGQTLALEFREVDLAAQLRRLLAEDLLEPRDRVELVAGEKPVVGDWAIDGILRALQNLIANAVKYGAPDAPIVVTLKQRDESAFLSVHNEGEPIPAEEQRDIFRPYRRTSRSEAGGAKGWGLGLSIVQAIAKAHGGKVTLKSTRQAGTTFTLEMPIRTGVERDDTTRRRLEGV